MSNSSEPLTALQLYEIRVSLRQSAVAMAGLLGVNCNTYYHYERTGKIPRPVAVAARFLSTQTQLAERPTEKSRGIAKFKARFLPGARFGKLMVVSHAPSTTPSSKRPHVHAQCDCGRVLTLQIHDLELMTQCGPGCKAILAAPATALPPSTLADDDGGSEDTLGLDATYREELAFMLRKQKAEEAERQARLDAALDELNDASAPGEELPPLDEDLELEEGL